MLSTDDYLHLDATAMLAGLGRGEWCAVDLVETATALAQKLNPTLNAITIERYEQARELAAEMDRKAPDRDYGPLRGIPFLIKEISAVAGLPHHHHSRLFAAEIASQDAPIVSAFKQSGLVPLGTTNTPELCLTITTESGLVGPCHNPWELNHSTGGSSGGSAAAVAARIVPVAHGSDGGGSIRVPAACCGVFGLKVSRGLTPVEPQRHGSWSGLSVGHVLSRSVRDSALLLDAIRLQKPLLYPLPPVQKYVAGLDQSPGPLRIAIQREHPFGAEIDQQVAASLQEAERLCRSLGHKLTECAPPVDYASLGKHFAAITNVHTYEVIQPQLRKRQLTLDQAPLEGATRRMAERGRDTSAADFVAALDGVQLAAMAMEGFHRDFDIILSPVITQPPAPLGWLDMDSKDLKEYGRRFGAYSGFCHLYNATGQPSMSVPLYQSREGLPLGIMFSAAWGADALLLRLARQLELAQPWQDRLPPVLKTIKS
ncbi:MAG: amidase family protein [Pseudohongiellaceae bacterium]